MHILNITGEKEVLSVDDVLNLVDRLKKNEAINCPKCGSGILQPYNTTADKAHDFNCTNAECNFRVHCDANIDVE